MDRKGSVAELLKLVQGFTPPGPRRDAQSVPASNYSYVLSIDGVKRPICSSVEPSEQLAIENGRLVLQVEVMIARLDGAAPRLAEIEVFLRDGVAATSLGAWNYDAAQSEAVRWRAA